MVRLSINCYQAFYRNLILCKTRNIDQFSRPCCFRPPVGSAWSTADLPYGAAFTAQPASQFSTAAGVSTVNSKYATASTAAG
jgi:hypothetical protein